MAYLWLKVLHLFFVTSWFAGIFYLPRIFVNMAQYQPNTPEYTLLLGMAKRLLRFTTIVCIPGIIFGAILISYWGMKHGWLHAKLLVVLLLIIYHYACYRIYTQFKAGNNRKDHVYYRWFNEIPVLFLLAILVLVLLKPF